MSSTNPETATPLTDDYNDSLCYSSARLIDAYRLRSTFLTEYLHDSNQTYSSVAGWAV